MWGPKEPFPPHPWKVWTSFLTSPHSRQAPLHSKSSLWDAVGPHPTHPKEEQRRRGAGGMRGGLFLAQPVAYSGNGSIKGIILKGHQETCAWEGL